MPHPDPSCLTLCQNFDKNSQTFTAGKDKKCGSTCIHYVDGGVCSYGSKRLVLLIIFRKDVPPRSCTLCGKWKSKSAKHRTPDITAVDMCVDMCNCPHPVTCPDCKQDGGSGSQKHETKHLLADLE